MTKEKIALMQNTCETAKCVNSKVKIYCVK